MKRLTVWAMPALFVGMVLSAVSSACGEEHQRTSSLSSMPLDSARMEQIKLDSIRALESDSLTRYESLTEADFQLAADQLGVEVAAIKAVVEIEAGKAMKGFYAPGVPVVNFDQSMYKIYAKKAESTAGDKNAKVPAGLEGRALMKWKKLVDARRKNAQGADMATFWGMFQIGGFNYKRCGCKSIQEFVERMSYSELEQLELFVEFLISSDYVKYLKDKDWAKFARKYNGPGYAKRGYHTKMAKAYEKFSK